MKSKLKKICEKYKIEFLVVFGSFVKGNMTYESDVDVMISRERSLTLKQDLALRHELGQIFKREIDLVTFKKATPLLLGEIAKSGELYYGKKKDFHSFQIYAMKRYIDFAPYFKMREDLIKDKLKNA